MHLICRVFGTPTLGKMTLPSVQHVRHFLDILGQLKELCG